MQVCSRASCTKENRQKRRACTHSSSGSAEGWQ
ncbi:unnamed protein product [Ectocarpus sp. CCAP 1310/34]|nr:unnamed protein product [Ectocarpus sp. CCAP 1310/34]